MRTLPPGMAAVLQHFSRLFTAPTWRHVQVLLTGAIICQGARRVSTILRGFCRKKAVNGVIFAEY